MQSVDVTNMVWRPSLVRLTLMPRPEVDDGAKTAAFVDPAVIGAIWRTNVPRDNPDGGKPVPGDTYTLVHCCHYTIMVCESPEEVARLRDRAHGHEQKPRSVS